MDSSSNDANCPDPHAPPYDTWHVIPKAPVYRIQDVHDFESQLCRIQQNIEQPTPDAQQRMDEFLLVRAQEIEDEKLVNIFVHSGS